MGSDARMLLGEDVGVPRKNQERPGRERRAGGKGECDTRGETQSAQVERSRAAVLQLQEFRLVAAHASNGGWVVVQLREPQRAVVRTWRELDFDESAPLRASADARLNDRPFR